MFVSRSGSAQFFRENLTRRDFLRFFGLGLAGFLLPAHLIPTGSHLTEASFHDKLLGRVALEGILLHEEPSAESPVLKAMPLDSLWKISGVTLGKDDVSDNRIWYRFGEEGYAHSRRIQPVRNRLNPTNTIIPKTGCLGEVTVPFVDAYSRIRADRSKAYRLYYATTYWVQDRVVDDDGGSWYQILDDYFYNSFYVPAETLRLVPEWELSPLSPDIHPDDKQLLLDLPTQSLTAYEKDKVVFMARISSGVRTKEGGFATQTGHYRTTHKRPCRHMVTGPSEFGMGFDLPGVPWVCYFTADGVALHGTFWHNDFGVPHSHGCINMTPQAAKWVYRWTNPTVPADRYYYSELTGTRLIIQ